MRKNVKIAGIAAVFAMLITGGVVVLTTDQTPQEIKDTVAYAHAICPEQVVIYNENDQTGPDCAQCCLNTTSGNYQCQKANCME